MTPTEGELIQIQSQAEFMAMGFGTREWKLMAEAIKELRKRRAEDRCKCNDPEPALVDHGLNSICEKCGQLIGATRDERATERA